jgi:hypothetical protein
MNREIRPMNTRAAFILLVAAFGSGCALVDPAGSVDQSVHATVSSTDQAVEQFLAGRDLDPIEGAWEHDQSAFEFVIARNDFDIAPGYDYVGVMTLPDQSSWKQGDIKVLLRKTGEENVYDGVWMTRYKSRRPMTFVFENRNLIQANFVSNDGNTYFLRIRRVHPHFASN